MPEHLQVRAIVAAHRAEHWQSSDGQEQRTNGLSFRSAATTGIEGHFDGTVIGFEPLNPSQVTLPDTVAVKDNGLLRLGALHLKVHTVQSGVHHNLLPICGIASNEVYRWTESKLLALRMPGTI